MEERINKLIINEGITPTKFADVIGVQRSAISHILSGRNKPSFDLIHKILQKYPRLSAEWLIMGRGEMYKTTIQQKLFDLDTKPVHEELPLDAKKDPIIQDDTEKKEESLATENVIIRKTIDRIVIFYNDKTFKEYLPTE